MSLVKSSEFIAFTNSFGQKEATSTPDACSSTHRHKPPHTLHLDVRYKFDRECRCTQHNSRAHAFVIWRTTRISPTSPSHTSKIPNQSFAYLHITCTQTQESNPAKRICDQYILPAAIHSSRPNHRHNPAFDNLHYPAP